MAGIASSPRLNPFKTGGRATRNPWVSSLRLASGGTYAYFTGDPSGRALPLSPGLSVNTISITRVFESHTLLAIWAWIGQARREGGRATPARRPLLLEQALSNRSVRCPVLPGASSSWAATSGLRTLYYARTRRHRGRCCCHRHQHGVGASSVQRLDTAKNEDRGLNCKRPY